MNKTVYFYFPQPCDLSLSALQHFYQERGLLISFFLNLENANGFFPIDFTLASAQETNPLLTRCRIIAIKDHDDPLFSLEAFQQSSQSFLCLKITAFTPEDLTGLVYLSQYLFACQGLLLDEQQRILHSPEDLLDSPNQKAPSSTLLNEYYQPALQNTHPLIEQMRQLRDHRAALQEWKNLLFSPEFQQNKKTLSFQKELLNFLEEEPLSEAPRKLLRQIIIKTDPICFPLLLLTIELCSFLFSLFLWPDTFWIDFLSLEIGLFFLVPCGLGVQWLLPRLAAGFKLLLAQLFSILFFFFLGIYSDLFWNQDPLYWMALYACSGALLQSGISFFCWLLFFLRTILQKKKQRFS